MHWKNTSATAEVCALVMAGPGLQPLFASYLLLSLRLELRPCMLRREMQRETKEYNEYFELVYTLDFVCQEFSLYLQRVQNSPAQTYDFDFGGLWDFVVGWFRFYLGWSGFCVWFVVLLLFFVVFFFPIMFL